MRFYLPLLSFLYFPLFAVSSHSRGISNAQKRFRWRPTRWLRRPQHCSIQFCKASTERCRKIKQKRSASYPARLIESHLYTDLHWVDRLTTTMKVKRSTKLQVRRSQSLMTPLKPFKHRPRVSIHMDAQTSRIVALTNSSVSGSVTTSTSNVAKANQNDWDLLLSALISKHSTSLSNEDYLKLCESSASLFSSLRTLQVRC